VVEEKHGEIDAHSGMATTGHDWDGIKELNTPLPRWWLYTFYACIVWAIGYWLVYPAWPTLNGYTHGLSNWHTRAAVSDDLNELKAMRGSMNDKIAAASLAEIERTPELLSFARAQGAAAFAIHCSTCHGAGGQGSKGYPNLNADRWIWGGTLEAIETTIMHGARWDADPETHASLMPSFGRDSLLNEPDMSDVTDYVRTLSGNPPEKGADLTEGHRIFDQNCAACHGVDGKGNRELGAPDLTTQVWLYGSSKAAIMERVQKGGGGVMPAWANRLDPTTIKALAVYVHTLGGGK
jgi:cytochrome c oxidase cbb3-type subunit III